jgi:hypothetical protein
MPDAPPKTLNARHYLVAMLVATGKTNVEIGRVIGMHPERVSTIRKSPLFQALVERTLREIRERTLGAVIEKLQAEAGETLDVLLALRGTAAALPTLTVDDKKLALAATRELFARQVPAETKTTEERRVVHLTIGAEELKALMAAMAEDGGPPRLVGASSTATASGLTLDDAIKAATVAEAAEDDDD